MRMKQTILAIICGLLLIVLFVIPEKTVAADTKKLDGQGMEVPGVGQVCNCVDFQKVTCTCTVPVV